MALSHWVSAQDVLVVTRQAWEGLASSERSELQLTRTIELREASNFAIIIDNQGVNESTPGTNGGAALGGAIANAAYIDHALKSQNNYSAKTQLAAGILGALVGSSLDQAPVSQFHFRYALRRFDGEIEYRDVLQPNAFRHPVGVCLDKNILQPVSQALCTQTADDLKPYLRGARAQKTETIQSVTPPEPTVLPQKTEGTVQCKIGNLAPVPASIEKCNLIGGIAI
jgi:hypothetical protein